jgi:hypothetical protein
MFPKLSLVVASVLIVSSPGATHMHQRTNYCLFSDPCCRQSAHAPPPPPRSSQCCKRVVSSTSAAASAAAALVEIDLTGLNVPIGLSCSPITVAGNNWYVFYPIAYPLLSALIGGSTAVNCDAPQQQWGL